MLSVCQFESFSNQSFNVSICTSGISKLITAFPRLKDELAQDPINLLMPPARPNARKMKIAFTGQINIMPARTTVANAYRPNEMIADAVWIV
jgi:hypothetical protein